MTFVRGDDEAVGNPTHKSFSFQVNYFVDTSPTSPSLLLLGIASKYIIEFEISLPSNQSVWVWP